MVTKPIAHPFVIGSTVTSSSGKQAVIGKDFETGADIAVGDTERCGGFYVLGEPRTGKSNLLISMALEDIKNGHGLLFIDPHTEAINKLIARIPRERLKDVVYLDPTKTDRSFENLLHCKDRKSPLELERTTGRVRDIFAKVWGAAGELWKKMSAPVRCYVLCRAADSLSFGERYSSLPRSAFAPYEDLVVALVSLSKDTKARLDEAEEKEQAAEERKRIEKECAEKAGRISYSPPAVLEARVLDAAQIRAVRDVCIKVIKEGPKDVYETAATIDEFARFCVLLAQPENHIKVRSTQYVEKPVRSRTEIDMVNEISREFVNLPKYTTYARLVGEKDGKAIVWKGKVRTIELPGVAADAFYQALEAIEKNALPFSKPRVEIRKEIEKRQEPWRRRVRMEAPSVRIAEKKAPPSERRVPGPEEPMPPKFFTPD